MNDANRMEWQYSSESSKTSKSNGHIDYNNLHKHKYLISLFIAWYSIILYIGTTGDATADYLDLYGIVMTRAGYLQVCRALKKEYVSGINGLGTDLSIFEGRRSRKTQTASSLESGAISFP